MGRTLYEIEGDILALDNLLSKMGGDITDEQADAAINEWLHENQNALTQKLDSYAAVIREREAAAKVRSEEAARLLSLAEVDTNTVKRLKARLMEFMVRTGQQKLESSLFKFSVCGNGGKAPLVLDTDNYDALPSWAVKTEVKPNNDAIRIALESGDTLGWAHIEPRGSHLRIT